MKNSQKGFIVPVLLVIIALLVIGGGVYIYENKSSSQVNNSNELQTSQNTAPDIKPSLDPKSTIPKDISTDTATTTIMQGVSMQPTYKSGTKLKISRDVSVIKRNQVIIFTHTSNPNAEFIKRVIGLPGETISIVKETIYINGSQINIPQIPSVKGPDIAPIKLGNDEYYVLGDNTVQSFDSRAAGSIRKKDITGIIMGIF